MTSKFIGITVICLMTLMAIIFSAESAEHDDFQEKKVNQEARAEISRLNPELLFGSFAFRPLNNRAYREYLKNKKIWFGRSFEPWPIPANPSWRENPFSDRTWLMKYHSLQWLYSPAHAYLETGQNDYLYEIIYYIFSWIRSHPISKHSEKEMAWHDGATVRRTHLLVYLYHKILKEKLTNAQTRIYIKSLSKHGDHLERLVNKSDWKGHNHNLMHSRALYDLAVAFPQLPKST
ncbi:MAG: heparinase II/III family protein [Desulfobacterales bacterium]